VFDSPDKATPLLEVEGLRRHFHARSPMLPRLVRRPSGAVVKALDGVSFTIGRGETLALVGESGSGKSTAARCIVGLDRPTAGRIVFDGQDLAVDGSRRTAAPRRGRMQMIFQNPYASLDPRWRVRDTIAEPLRAGGLLRNAAQRRERVAELLHQVRLAPSDGERYPHEFSGGQRQRIAIARAIAAVPELIVCDEPTSALDVSVQAQILNLMKDLQRRFGLAYLFISHDLAVVYQVSDRVGVVYLGRLVELADCDRLFAHPRHPYTRLLLDAVPSLEENRARQPLADEPPDPIAPPPGCSFHPRCPFAAERCRSEIPLMKPTEGSLVACHAVEEGRLPTQPAPWPPLAPSARTVFSARARGR